MKSASFRPHATPAADEDRAAWLSVDWGNSSFRARLVESGSPPRIRWASRSDVGTLDAYREWQETDHGKTTQSEAMRKALCRLITDALAEHDVSPDGIRAVVSGMASSSVGIESLPYAHCPFRLDGSALSYKTYPPDKTVPVRLEVMSGLCDDVSAMRGEETLLVGLFAQSPESFDGKVRVVMPGTHAVHVSVTDGHAVGIRTFMTGELFELLRKKSILAQSVTGDTLSAEDARSDGFREGVQTALREGLPVSLFRVRARYLLHNRRAHENTCFLSGLLIGTEAAVLATSNAEKILVAAPERPAAFYRSACEIAGVQRVRFVPPRELDTAIVYGQARLPTP